MGKKIIVVYVNELMNNSVNRDRNGSLKTTVDPQGRQYQYISSQCQNHCDRSKKMDDPDNRQGIKVDLDMAKNVILKNIAEIGGLVDEKKIELTMNSVLKAYGLITTKKKNDGDKSKKKDGENNAEEKKYVDNLVVFLSAREIECILKDLSVDNWAVLDKDQKEIEKVIANATKKVQMSRDIALFGRMIASNTELNVHGALDRSDWIGIFPRKIVYDFYTASSDNKDQQEAINLGNVEVASSLGYSAFVIDTNQLKVNLNDDGEWKAMLSWEYLKDFVECVGNSRQHSKFCQTRPLYIAMIVTDGNGFTVPNSAIAKDGDTKQALQSIHDYLTECVNDPNNASDNAKIAEYSPSYFLNLKCDFNEFIRKNVIGE